MTNLNNITNNKTDGNAEPQHTVDGFCIGFVDSYATTTIQEVLNTSESEKQWILRSLHGEAEEVRQLILSTLPKAIFEFMDETWEPDDYGPVFNRADDMISAIILKLKAALLPEA